MLLAGAGVAWWQREPLQVWWALRGLRRAGEADRAAWVERVAKLGEPGLRSLVDSLADANDAGCRNLLGALDDLARAAGPADPTVADVAARLGRAYSGLKPSMQAQALATVAGWVRGPELSDGLAAALAQLIADSASSDDADVQSAALDLASVLVRHPRGESAVGAARDLARGGLRSSSADVRLKAVRLCLQPGMELLEQLVGLLRDPAAEVRRAAIVAVGPAEQLVREDVLLPGLHDPDEEVRKHTEAALRGRGLRPEHLEMGRLLTHPKAAARLQVLDRLRTILDGGKDEAADLDPGVWMRRLSHDPSPAVRAAALRLMSQQAVVDLSDRIDQMARSDPSETVCQLARFYLGKK